jgi:hypothetical protein
MSTPVDELETAELEEIAHNAAAELERRRALELAPHKLHRKPRLVTAAEADELGIEAGTRVQLEVHCPDCTGGLRSRGTDMICERLKLDERIRGCHPQCIVACGLVR